MRVRAVAVILGLALAACGGTAPSAEPAGSPGSTSSVAPTGAPVDPASTPRSPAKPPAPADLDAAVARPAAAATATGDRLIEALVDGSGLAGALGSGTGASVESLLAAEHEAATAELVRLGGDPVRLDSTLVGSSARSGVSLAVARPGAFVGVLALALAISDTSGRLAEATPDEKGNVHLAFSVTTNAPAGAGGTIRLDESVSIDLARCPDGGGRAEATVTLDLALSATVDLGDGARTYSGQGVISFVLAADSTPDAELADVTSAATGTLTTSSSDIEFLDLDGLGGRLPFAGGVPDSGAMTGSGEYSGRGDEASATALTGAVIKAGLVLATAHAVAAELHWKSGACLVLEVTPPDPRVAGPGGKLDLAVKAVSTVDDAAVEGSLEIAATAGTFEPARARTPASITATVDDQGEAHATLTFRSLRGVATGESDVYGGDYEVTFESTASYTSNGLVIETKAKATVTMRHDSADGRYRGTGTLRYVSFTGRFTSGPADLRACKVTASTTNGTIDVMAQLDPTEPDAALVWLAPGPLRQGIPNASCRGFSTSVRKDWPGWTPSFTQASAKRQRTIDGNAGFYEFDGFAAGSDGAALSVSGRDTGTLGPLPTEATYSIELRRVPGT